MDYNEKQIQIIDAAEKRFAENGFEGTSVRDIAHDAGINIAMISYYFGSKEKLLEAIFNYRIKTTGSNIEKIIHNDNLSPIQKIDKFIDNYIDRMLQNQSFYRLMMQEPSLKELHQTSEIVYEAKMQNMELIKKTIQEGQALGAFKKNIDVPMMIMTMIGTANHFISTQHFYRRYNNLIDTDDIEFQKHIKKKLSHHLKALFKSTLTNAA
jgi:AcrR family transcriptional regulator